MRSKAELIKTASTLRAFTTKIKEAQEGINGIGMAQTLTPEAVQDIAMEINQVAEVAAELAEEIVEGVPAENGGEEGREEAPPAETPQIETAQDSEEDEEKKMLKEQVANLSKDLAEIKLAKQKETLASKYASLFTPNQREAKMKEILEASDGIEVLTAKVKEAANLINGKQVVKVASGGKSIFDLDESDNSEEVNIANKL